MSRYEAVSYNSNAMKTIAMEHKVCVVSAVQLNRGLEKRQDATPQLSDLRDSGDIEQDADQVILLHRNDEKKLFFVEVKKNRHDRTVDIVFDYEPETQYLEEHQWNV
jgi:replicative DNA helicase